MVHAQMGWEWSKPVPFLDLCTWELCMLKDALILLLSICLPSEQYLELAAQMRSLSHWIFSKFEKEIVRILPTLHAKMKKQQKHCVK